MLSMTTLKWLKLPHSPLYWIQSGHKHRWNALKIALYVIVLGRCRSQLLQLCCCSYGNQIENWSTQICYTNFYITSEYILFWTKSSNIRKRNKHKFERINKMRLKFKLNSKDNTLKFPREKNSFQSRCNFQYHSKIFKNSNQQFFWLVLKLLTESLASEQFERNLVTMLIISRLVKWSSFEMNKSIVDNVDKL